MKESPFEIDDEQAPTDGAPVVGQPARNFEAARKAKKRVVLPGRLMMAAGLIGMAPSVTGLIFALIALPQVASGFDEMHELYALIVFAGIAIGGLVWYGVTVYGGVMLLERKNSGMVWASIVMLLIGAPAAAMITNGYYWFHGFNGLLVIITCVMAVVALQNADVQSAMRNR